jgi:hypothetical protein
MSVTSGFQSKGLHLILDNGCQPSPVSFMARYAKISFKQAFTEYRNQKGNKNGQLRRSIKEKRFWLK